MKLLLITSIAEFSKEVKQILKNTQVKAYSYRDVTGYRDATEEAINSNWFGSEMNENESVLFYAFVPQQNVDSIYAAIEEFNAKQQTPSRIHIAIINIEKSN